MQALISCRVRSCSSALHAGVVSHDASQRDCGRSWRLTAYQVRVPKTGSRAQGCYSAEIGKMTSLLWNTG